MKHLLNDPPCRVMIVDDYPDAAESLRMLLELDGHEVRALKTAGDLLAQARAFKPRVIVLDTGRGIPKSGLEWARRLRSTPDLKDVALVAWTGHGRKQDIAAGLAAGFDHYLVKPVDPDLIASLVNEECEG